MKSGPTRTRRGSIIAGRVVPLRCLTCGFVVPIRRMHRRRGKNHVNNLWCPRCHAVTKHIQRRAG